MDGRTRPRGLPLSLDLPVEGGAWLKESSAGNEQACPANLRHTHDDTSESERTERPQTFIFHANTSASDLVTPVTPTFSQRGPGSQYLRYSSSASSLDLFPTLSLCSDAPLPPSPTQMIPIPPPVNINIPIKSPLPDVQEEPVEHDTELEPALRKSVIFPGSLYDCLCDLPCIHKTRTIAPLAAAMSEHGAWAQPSEYDAECFSDGEAESKSRSRAHSRTSMDLPLSGLTSKIGSKMQTLNRWRSTKRRTRAMTASSDSAFDLSPAFSRATSASRSSSLSGPGRMAPDRSHEPPLPPTPALSIFETSDMAEQTAALDLTEASVRESLERDRNLAHTPLLPPLLNETLSTQLDVAQPSPLQPPTVVSLPTPSLPPPPVLTRPSLSVEPSPSLLRPPLMTSMSAPVVGTAELCITIPSILEQHDEWSDVLGHANFIIQPKPYDPILADVERLDHFCIDWDQARVNYTKHIVRTGEHYGLTSKIYSLTEAKWEDTEKQWMEAYDGLLARLVLADQLDPAKASDLRQIRAHNELPSVVPSLLGAEGGKFPSLGDEDIVGPMTRDAVMQRDDATGAGILDDGRHGGATRFWKSLAGKVGLRK